MNFIYERTITYAKVITVYVEALNANDAKEAAEEYLTDELSTDYPPNTTIIDCTEENPDIEVNSAIWRSC